MSLDTETTHDFAVFEHFGRTWSVPTKRHLSHLRRLRDEFQTGVGTWSLLIAETFLAPSVSASNLQKPDQFEALLELDPSEAELKAFAQKISAALGTGDQGNSEPSSSSS